MDALQNLLALDEQVEFSHSFFQRLRSAVDNHVGTAEASLRKRWTIVSTLISESWDDNPIERIQLMLDRSDAGGEGQYDDEGSGAGENEVEELSGEEGEEDDPSFKGKQTRSQWMTVKTENPAEGKGESSPKKRRDLSHLKVFVDGLHEHREVKVRSSLCSIVDIILTAGCSVRAAVKGNSIVSWRRAARVGRSARIVEWIGRPVSRVVRRRLRLCRP
jgi:hypothetical protein